MLHAFLMCFLILTVSCASNSSSNRSLKPYYTGILVTFPSAGIEFNYHLNEQQSIFAKKIVSPAANLNSAGYKHFIGNSFYIQGGLTVGQHTEYFGYDDLLQLSFSHAYTVTKSFLGLSSSIGNMWVSDYGFSIGMEWLGFAIPLSYYGDTIVEKQVEDRSVDDQKVSESKLNPAWGMMLTLGFSI